MGVRARGSERESEQHRRQERTLFDEREGARRPASPSSHTNPSLVPKKRLLYKMNNRRKGGQHLRRHTVRCRQHALVALAGQRLRVKHEVRHPEAALAHKGPLEVVERLVQVGPQHDDSGHGVVLRLAVSHPHIALHALAAEPRRIRLRYQVAALHYVAQLAHGVAGCRAHWPPATGCWATQCIRASPRRRSTTSPEASRGGKASAQMTGTAGT